MEKGVDMQRLRDAVESMLRETVARGDTVAPGWRDEICAIARTMIAEEREACAKVCEAQEVHGIGHPGTAFKVQGMCIDAIRARSNVELRGRPLADGPA